MALPDLIARLEQDADHQVQGILRAADEEARAIEVRTAHALAQAGDLRLGRRRAERLTTLGRALAEARRTARARELEARHALWARVRQRADGLLNEVARSDAYSRALVAHTDEALAYLERVPCRVRCARACVPVVQLVAARRDDVTIVEDETMGPGVMVEAVDGSVTVDNTLAARLARQEPRLVVELLGEARDERA